MSVEATSEHIQSESANDNILNLTQEQLSAQVALLEIEIGSLEAQKIEHQRKISEITLRLNPSSDEVFGDSLSETLSDSQKKSLNLQLQFLKNRLSSVISGLEEKQRVYKILCGPEIIQLRDQEIASLKVMLADSKSIIAEIEAEMYEANSQCEELNQALIESQRDLAKLREEYNLLKLENSYLMESFHQNQANINNALNEIIVRLEGKLTSKDRLGSTTKPVKVHTAQGDVRLEAPVYIIKSKTAIGLSFELYTISNNGDKTPLILKKGDEVIGEFSLNNVDEAIQRFEREFEVISKANQSRR